MPPSTPRAKRAEPPLSAAGFSATGRLGSTISLAGSSASPLAAERWSWASGLATIKASICLTTAVSQSLALALSLTWRMTSSTVP